MKKIEIYGSEAKRFHEHINNEQNFRIMFSAPYGYGKTTFLRQISNIEYGAKEFPADMYNFFHIYPVNYSVANNEDIFQYIKYDLIYSLIENKFPLTKKDFFIPKGMKKYLKTNAHILASKLLLFVPSVGKDLLNVFDELNKVKDEIIDACEDEAKDEEDNFSQFLIDSQTKTGSIYELDLFTKTIQNVLKRIKLDEEGNNIKENILVIDDLDRIDPAHIFRILNVFSAHLDKDGENNKYGFDKVVLVCDLANIRRIFSHIYGQSVDFNGYIDKFYSTTVFEFANSKVIEQILSNEIQKNNLNRFVFSTDGFRTIVSILTTFIFNGKLNLRRIQNVSIVNVENTINNLNRSIQSPMKQLALFEVSIFLIEVLGNYENLITTIEELSKLYEDHKAVNDTINDFETFYMNYILPVLVADKTGIKGNELANYNYHGEAFRVKWKTTDNNHTLVQNEETKKSLYKIHMWSDFLLAVRILHKNRLI